jgi:capsular polysaccharide transport system permease protein
MPPEAPDAWADVIQLAGMSRPSPVFEPPPVRRRWRSTVLRFALIVMLPTMLGATYFGFVAPNRYVAEAKFQVRKPNAPGHGAGPGLSIEDGPKGFGNDDSYAVRDFMVSRDAMKLLEERGDFRAALTRTKLDPLWQFPGFINGHTNEDLYDLYKSLVTVDYESSTGVTTLEVQAFMPTDARRITEVLMAGGEDLVNRLNAQARHDAVQLAEAEVERGRAEARQAEAKVTEFREKHSVIDPTLVSKAVLTTISTLSLQLVETAAELDVTVHASPRSPQIPLLRGRVQALQDQIDHERSTLAGSNQSLAPEIAQYESLTLDREFADRIFISSLNLLEAARLDVERQQEYLERVVEPAVPDKALYPRRVLWTLGIFVTGFTIFLLFRPAPVPVSRPML